MHPLRPEFAEAQIAPDWTLHSARALFWRPERLLVVADLHWGYAESHRRQGHLLPPVGDEDLGRRLDQLVAFYAPQRLLWLGDSLHTGSCKGEAEKWLDALPRELEVILIAGNHDRTWARARLPYYRAGRYVFHHGDRAILSGLREDEIEIVGHFHPAIALGDGAGTRLKLPAFVQMARRWILPSFSDWAAGAAWLEPLAPGDKIWAVTAKRIWVASGPGVG